ncbi:MAG: Holliday junction branch migration protein RuvA [Pseudomonadota bacterium]
MIAKLTGTLDDFGPDWAVIDVAGVGYLVQCSARTLAALGVRGDRVTVHTEMQVSENDMRLIGFASGGEREWFRLLTGVQGVGSKMALAVLSALTVEELQRACAGGAEPHWPPCPPVRPAPMPYRPCRTWASNRTSPPKQWPAPWMNWARAQASTTSSALH